MSRIILLSNNSGNGNGNPREMPRGGEFVASFVGTFNGATVKLQQKGPDMATWIDIPSASVTAAGTFIVTLAGGVDIRAVISGGTSPTGMYCHLDPV